MFPRLCLCLRRSPLENHHLAAAFTVLQQPEYNFTAGER